MILSKRHKSALPLNVYGDGMKKAILMLSAVIKSKGGILLLDEFFLHISTKNSLLAFAVFGTSMF